MTKRLPSSKLDPLWRSLARGPGECPEEPNGLNQHKHNIMLETNRFLFKLIERLGTKGWRGTLESTRRLLSLLTKAQLCVFGSLSKEHCLGMLYMSKEIIRLYRMSGALFVGQYLKHVSFMLMWYVGGDRSQRPSMKTFVSLTKSGIPRFLPPFYRKRIRQGNGDLIVKFVLTICSLHKLIIVGPRGGSRINPSTIHQPNYQPPPSCKALCVELLSRAHAMLSAYAPSFTKIPLQLGFRWRPTFSSGPNTYKNPVREARGVRLSNPSGKKRSMTIYHTLPIDAMALITLFKPEDLSYIASMWVACRTHYVTSGFDDPIERNEEGVIRFGPLLDTLVQSGQTVWWETMKTRPEAGRFGRKLEGAGKVRIFAIASPLFQALVRPLHDWVMAVLRTIPMDGTFHQHRPLELLKGHRDLYSFDLKSATDLLPIDLSGSMLVGLMGQEFGQSWCWIMTMPGFRSPEKFSSEDRAHVHRFTRGQPLGYYSSWPVFTLTHHMLVWYSAWRVYPGRRFKDYAILGDDIVIADTKVALEYRKIMNEAEAVISIEKSLISHSGSFEFAKKFIVRNHLSTIRDLSPYSLRIIRSLYGFVSAYTFSMLGVSLSTSFRLRGAGYKVYSRVQAHPYKNMSKKWLRHWLCSISPNGINPLPFELWLAYPERGILSCYELGRLRFFILKRVAPKDLDEKSFDEVRAFWGGDAYGMFEATIEPVVALHLKYLKWYADALFDYSLSWKELLSPPVSPRALRRESVERMTISYGIMFRCWDFVRTHSMDKENILDCGRTNLETGSKEID